MLTQDVSSIVRLSSLAIMTGILFQPAQLRAQTLDIGAPPAASAPASTQVCALLQKQLRWHEPFFGLRTWSEVASEALSFAPKACREAIATGQAPQVAAAVAELLQHDTTDAVPLRR